MKPAVHEELIEGALARERGAVARLVSLFQDRREGAAERRAAILAALDEGGVSQAPVLGITGTPGSGKSSLIGRIAGEMLGADDELGLAVLAVDPSSHISGGALLGDRTRLRLDGRGERLFFRSEASATELGGLSPSTFQVSRLLVRLYDAVIVETVGIGQSEADIRWLADRVLLVVSPLGGDEIQFLKAGIIEIPDAFVVNMADRPGAQETVRHLRLAAGRSGDVFQTVALDGTGVPELREGLTKRWAGLRERNELDALRQAKWGSDAGLIAQAWVADCFDSDALDPHSTVLAAVSQILKEATTRWERQWSK